MISLVVCFEFFASLFEVNILQMTKNEENAIFDKKKIYFIYSYTHLFTSKQDCRAVKSRSHQRVTQTNDYVAKLWRHKNLTERNLLKNSRVSWQNKHFCAKFDTDGIWYTFHNVYVYNVSKAAKMFECSVNTSITL